MTAHPIVVWLDHHEAKLFHVDAPGLDRAELHVAKHLHHAGKTGAPAETHRQAADDHPFFDSISRHLGGLVEILVVGPSSAKTELVTYLKAHHKDVAAKVVGVEAADHPTDGQILAHARKYFGLAVRP
jgi:stalled ribosome rescue protein Dom34